MRRLTKALAVMTLALWAVAAMHCTLEQVPGFGFLASCCATDAGGANQEDCGSDGCSLVEKGNYRIEEHTASAPPPFLVLLALPALLDPPALEPRSLSPPASESPPELPRLWQFTSRAALPPRAPDLAS